MALSRVSGKEDLYVGGIFALRSAEALKAKKITHVLSVIKYSLDHWGEEAEQFQHVSIDLNDVDDEDILAHFSSAVRFIESGLYPATADARDEATAPDKPRLEGGDLIKPPPPSSPGAVFVHCAMGKSRSVSCVVAWLLYKYPHRFGGKQAGSSAASSTARRRETASKAVYQALQWVRRERPLAEPNPGFMRQLELWWEMGCPAEDDRAVENHPIYQKWLYDCKLKEARDLGMAPEADWIRFEDEEQQPAESEAEDGEQSANPRTDDGREIRCKKCRRVLANAKFVVDHHGTGDGDGAATTTTCPHVFIETLSWMRPALEGGALDGRLNCPNEKCGATIGRFAWQGFKCSCGEWVCPAFTLNRSRVDEVVPLAATGHGIRMPPGRHGSL